MDRAPLRLSRGLQPVLRAYLLAYLSTTAPRVIALLLSASRRKLSLRAALAAIIRALRQQTKSDRFPAFCAVSIGGATIVPRLVWMYAQPLVQQKNQLKAHAASLDAVVRLGAAFVSAWAGFALLNQNDSEKIEYGKEPEIRPLDSAQPQTGASPKRPLIRRRSSVALGSAPPVQQLSVPPLAGRTLDLTTFAAVRAIGALLNASWHRYKNRSGVERSGLWRSSLLERFTAPMVFATSSAMVMWAWFYSPERLPRTYNQWITSAAQVDPRLVEALRQCRYGNFVYGKDTGLAPLLQDMCHDLNFPEEWGDPAKTIPVPCELYHSGTGPNCEWHAIVRFVRAWRFAMFMYLPLNMLMLTRRPPSKRSTRRAVVDASRSSAFLGAFVALFYYGVCCARTRIGPKLFSRDTVTPMMWDGGLCVGTGCAMCGWSILLEKKTRQPETAFFVAPRALATFLPRRYDRQFMRREQVVFSTSVAIVLTAAQIMPESLQGVFGRLMAHILR